jgi:predicted NACHT family NTPase
LNDYIIKTASRYDENLTDKKVEELMISGKCQILMDGADEIDPSDEKAFQRKIAELVDRYPYNQYVVASRECGLLKGITGFSRMYLHPSAGSSQLH